MLALRMRIGSVAFASVACGPSVGAGADDAGSGSAGDGAGSSTGAAATDAAETNDVTVSTSTAEESATEGPSGLCLSTVTIVLDTTDAYVGFADVDGDDRPELWRHEVLERAGANVLLLDVFLVEGDGTTSAVGTNQIEGNLVRFTDVDGDGADDLLTQPDFAGAQQWHRGQADLTFALPQPISLADDDFQSWLDADGDGDADVFGSPGSPVDPTATLYRGDGTGEFTSTATLQFPIGAEIHVVPTHEPGVLIASNYNGADAFGAAFSFWRIDVDARGVPTVGPGTPELPHEGLVAANDFDGDGVTDLLTRHFDPATELHLWTGQGDGYVERTVAADVHEVAVGDFLGDGGVQLLLTDAAANLWLLPTPVADGAEPLPVEGLLTGVYGVFDLGSDGQDEVVSRVLDGEGRSEYAMHDVVPCG